MLKTNDSLGPSKIRYSGWEVLPTRDSQLVLTCSISFEGISGHLSFQTQHIHKPQEKMIFPESRLMAFVLASSCCPIFNFSENLLLVLSCISGIYYYTFLYMDVGSISWFSNHKTCSALNKCIRKGTI